MISFNELPFIDAHGEGQRTHLGTDSSIKVLISIEGMPD